jgi:hypothetical protein
MIDIPSKSRQPFCEPWTIVRLQHKRAIAIGSAIDPSSLSSYSSALNSYITFCQAHQFPIDPTPETLSFYTVYMCHHIKPKSVDNYLSGISNQLEPFFPNVRSHRHHLLVTRTLKGCKKLRPSSISRKRPITRTELGSLRHHYLQLTLTTHDDKLFFAILLTGFHGLLRLGELVWPDNKSLQDYRKVILRHTTYIHDNSFDFHLPGHKGDRFFEGNQVIIQRTNTDDDPFSPFVTYLVSRDRLFPFSPELWLRSDGSIPTRTWFLRRLHQYFPDNVGGHSMRAGGATALAEAGLPPNIIQAIGRWSTEAFQVYIRQHPILLAALLFGYPTNPTS